MTAQKTRMLTAQELVQLRVKVDKVLPTKGTKEFQPSNSWLEKKQIQAALNERKILLEEERVERLGALTRAEWEPELKIAKVTHKVGRHWKQMGHEVGGKLHLLPEEALFLLETTCLELMHSGIAMSIQDGYSTLLGPNTGCTFNEYQTYVHLVRQGYIVLRHSKSIKATRYERQIRLHQYSVGQKQHKTKENASVQEILIEDGEIDTKENTGVIKSPLGSDSIQNNMKIEEQEIIDLETVETANINDDKAPFRDIIEMNGLSETSQSLEQFISRRKSSKCDDIKSTSAVFDKTVRSEAVGINVGSVTENEGGEEALKDETLVQEKDLKRQCVPGLNNNCKTDLELITSVHEPKSGENEKRVDGERGSSPKLHSKIHGVSGETGEREAVCGVTKESCGIMAVSDETVTVSNLEGPESDIHPQYEQGSKDIDVVNEIPLSHMTVSKCDSSVSESFKVLESTSGKMADVTIVDDSSTSVGVGQKEHSSEIEIQQIEHEGENKQKQFVGDRNVTQKPEKVFVDWNEVVDVSDSSQTSHPEIKIESSSNIRTRDIQNKTLLENNDEIEIVNIVDGKSDVDNEIVEVNGEQIPSTSGVGCTSKSRRRRSYQNRMRRNAVKNEIQLLEKNTIAVKPDVVDAENDTVANVRLLSMQNSNLGHSRRHLSKDITCLGKKKVTSIQLEHDERKITPSIIDISEEQGKLEIPVVDLEDEDVRPELSWEEERMKILDSIPSMDGKVIIHVSVPDKSLLPPNICPQNKDYYIQKYRLSSPGIGGKPIADLPDDRAHERSPQTDGQINPWIQNSTYNFGGGGGGGNMFGAAGLWSNSTFPMAGHFVNQHYQTPFPGRFEFQAVLHQAVAMLSALSNPALQYNRMFGMPALAPMPQHSRIPYGHRPLWHYQTRPYYHRPYYKRRGRRFETQYYRTPVKLGRHFENQGNSSSDIIPFRVDEVREPAQRAPSRNEVGNSDDDDDDDDDDDVIECVSVSSPVKVENESMDWKSDEGQSHDSNKNGIDRPNVGTPQKRKVSKNAKDSEPPKKLRMFIEKEEERMKDVLKAEVQKEPHQEVLQQEDMAATDVKSWRDFKTVMQVVVLDSSSEDEDDVHIIVDDTQGPEMEINEPLVQPEDCRDIGLILKKLQIIKSMNLEQERQCDKTERLKISFDLYLPSATFRKASPGLPNYRITIVGCEDPMPEPKEVAALLKDFEDDVPLLFAIVLPNTVTFLQFGSVTLPVETFCP
ncbi:hypothetical protein B7P43_G08403 [Cryptotermes secundus]|uniref:tRNA-splicing endonuclease subunit Sen54 N-terminal domain-containing protein n=1 Tax=Cryptotermes secundus TaxID=105785 RepID=A0A2J7PXG4_9NEOP|nr:uncharacterized protein LOC111871183 [Cryptotermes secundus]PNF21027.1 hypothetical protein B7P43_G08403 [Cryptotermes secundus]